MTDRSQRQRLIVQKFGGMSLATPEHIRNAAARVAALRAQGYGVIAVVSAMAKTTDELIKLAYSVSPSPNRRELDMLLSTGERVSMALFSMALTDALKNSGLGAKAISFTGSQAGILTDDTHSNARIIDVRPHRVQEEIDRGNVAILAGFQGVSPVSKEITTLGRGGTDVTAVAMAIAFNAERCEILKEVDGVLTADPRLVPSAMLIENLTLDELSEMTFWGAKVLHYRSVELALTHSVPLHIALAHPESGAPALSTKVAPNAGIADSLPKEIAMKQSVYENESVLSVNSHADVQRISLGGSDLSHALAQLEDTLRSAQLPLPQILEAHCVENRIEILFTAPAEALEAQVRCLANKSSVFALTTDPLATVTATCRGAVSRGLIGKLSAALNARKIASKQILVSSLSITFLIDKTQRDLAVETIHTFASPN
ncbi:MAG: aspartate kinase [Bdellovibrionaceae bacterium]|nr:aspartate kinase [Pseudobdellovibrionaceae bacterium]